MRILSKYAPLLVAFAALAALPFGLLRLGLTLTTATDLVILAIACMGLNVLVGTGLVSFGHGAFFGLAACAAALAQRHWFPGAIVAPALVAVAAVGVVAWLAGFLILRRGGVYFALLTLVLPGMLLAVAFLWTAFTGGDSGLRSVVRPSVAGIDLGEPEAYYRIVAAVAFAVTYLLWRFHRSPVGRVLVAIRENEQRARFIGYATQRYKLFAFTASAAITAIAGVLSVFHHRVASAEPMSFAFSGELLAMVVIGGMRSFLGPALGALVFILFRESLSVWTADWLLYFWLLFVGLVVVLPTGVVGLAGCLAAPFRKRATGDGAISVPDPAADAPLPAALADRPQADGPVLIARELSKSFGGIRAVAGADIVVEDRTLHALIGPNGAGKTTMLDLLCGLYVSNAGFITLANRAVAGMKPEALARAGIGRSFQTASLFGGLTVEENLRLAVQARRGRRLGWWRSADGRAGVNADTAAVMSYLGLTGTARAQAASLSDGGQRLLDIGLALATAPRVLLLDEPFAGLAAAERARVAALAKSLARQLPVLLVEHDIDRVASIADAVTVMNGGKVLLHGSVESARNDKRVREVYTGSGTAQVTAAQPASAAGAATLLAVDKIDVFRGRHRILDAVSLDVSEHEIVALLGRNGAGKSALLKALIGIAPPTSGSIRLAGGEIARRGPAEIARRGVGYVPQGSDLFAGMTVADNLALGRQARMTRNGVHWDDERIVWVFPRLAQRWYTPADRLSAGERQMVAVARALAGDVRLLLLDEPFEGLPPTLTGELFEAFNRLRYEVAMVIVDHHLDLALALSDRTVILDCGAVTWAGASKLLRDDVELKRQKLWM